MLAWLTIKASLKKAWAWFKHNWYVPAVIVYTIVLWFLFRDKSKALEVLEIRSNSYKEQVKAIEDSYKDEVEKRDQILERYNEVLSNLEKEYKEKNMLLDKKKKEEIKKIITEYNDSPDDLAKILAERYGLEYVQ
jgi:hypothetical protein|tara:strand:+ start:505 stop:909 length:405 start_codon:yes stop_codon:yes gene_type:complete